MPADVAPEGKRIYQPPADTPLRVRGTGQWAAQQQHHQFTDIKSSEAAPWRAVRDGRQRCRDVMSGDMLPAQSGCCGQLLRGPLSGSPSAFVWPVVSLFVPLIQRRSGLCWRRLSLFVLPCPACSVLFRPLLYCSSCPVTFFMTSLSYTVLSYTVPSPVGPSCPVLHCPVLPCPVRWIEKHFFLESARC